VHAALGVLEKHAPNTPVRRVLASVRRHVHDGQPLSAALAQSELRFPAELVGSVRAGEASGALAGRWPPLSRTSRSIWSTTPRCGASCKTRWSIRVLLPGWGC
jgi:type II secretory pathway component PulF